jgi:hypothetical protein
VLSTLKEFARKHIIWTAAGSLVMGTATGGLGVYWSLYEASVNRVEDMKVGEFQALVSETKKFQELLNAFTEELGTGGSVDQQKRKEMSASLVRLYSGLGAFTVNLPPEQEPPVKKLQTSINEVKKRIQITENKQDLEMLGGALANMFRDMKAAQPVLEQAVGKPIAAAAI